MIFKSYTRRTVVFAVSLAVSALMIRETTDPTPWTTAPAGASFTAIA